MRWTFDGTWQNILSSVLAAADADDDIGWTVRAHQHSAGSCKRGAEGRSDPADHPLGRSRGGLSTKVHLAAHDHARPLTLTVTTGQVGDAPAFDAVTARIPVPRNGPSRPRTQPLAVLADRAYSSRAIQSHLRRRGVRAVIPRRSATACGEDAEAAARPASTPIYKQRNSIEHCINRLKQWRGLATRCDKSPSPTRHCFLDHARSQIVRAARVTVPR
ncbi:IS5 family transposase [Streptomyces sp. NPDC059193]|uniref:IS5 family transposase n=1 Tax=Streptomyces sp. NPDC059193 TaxID=3346763 RepID=UPI0036C75E32